MKVKIKLLAIALIAIIGIAKAQTPSNTWQAALINDDGTNVNSGIEAYYKQSVCNTSDFILIKFKNSTGSPLKISWINTVRTVDGEEHSADAAVVLTIPANTESAGSCTGSEQKLKVKLSDIGVVVGDFETFIGKSFTIQSN